MPLNISVCCLRSSIRGIKKILGPSYFRFKVSDFTFFLHKRLFWPAYFPLEQWMACALRPTLARSVMGFLPSNKEEGRKKVCKQERKSVRAKSDSREEANWVGRSAGRSGIGQALSASAQNLCNWLRLLVTSRLMHARLQKCR